MNTELVIKILSMGIFASLVTGIFSLIVSIKNNRKLLLIEKQKEIFTMDVKRYEELKQLLEKVESVQFLFEKDQKAPDENLEYLSQVFGDTLNIFKTIKNLFEKNVYLLDNTLNIETKIEDIDDYISGYIEESKKGWITDIDEQVKRIDKICVDIYHFRDEYIKVLRCNIEKILKRK